MTRYVARRTLFLVLSLAVAMVVIFALLRLLPGDPANALLSIDATPEQIAAAREQVGADEPVLTQLTTWVGQVLSGNLGTSFISGREVLPDVVDRLAVTIPLTLISFVIAAVLASVVGFVAAYRADRWYGIALSGLAQLGIAVPVFWVGMILVWVFALTLGLYPSGGYPREGWEEPAETLRYLALPVATIVTVMTASLARYVRSASQDALGSDYLRTARSLGSSLPRAFWRHGARNASVPVIAILGVELATTLLGAVVVESVFSLPGLGSMLVRAIAQHDYPSIQGVLLVTTLLVLLIGFAADVLQRVVDPRLRARTAGRAA
ncbi:peptide/nickel transport system permease protein [Georgenia soli]|uniref:Peptide/nickel transport system permease protein n=1 Tax=Georgenia soli TaxID=638953 RepID=A0A2A9EQF5_9MICO|nr:ABC transporter permease [Georgenia soli]PFG40485.1 peptide/nickel transport system permease protein [Georgenia soli]